MWNNDLRSLWNFPLARKVKGNKSPHARRHFTWRQPYFTPGGHFTNPARDLFRWKKHAFACFFLARPEGFEPPSSRIGICYHIQLDDRRISLDSICFQWYIADAIWYTASRMIYLLRKHDIISVPHMPQAYIIARQCDIISKIYHPFVPRNGYHWKKSPLSVDKSDFFRGGE